MENFVYYGTIFDIYKDLLNEQSKKIFSLYYEENLTLQEIADNFEVSKSYIGNVIKKTKKKLDELEKILKIYEKKQKLKDLLDIEDINILKAKLNEIL